MKRLTFRIPVEQLNRMMVVAAARGIHSYTKAIREAIELWIVVMKNRESINGVIQDGDVHSAWDFLWKIADVIEPEERKG